MPSKQHLAATAAVMGGLLAVGGTTYAFADSSQAATGWHTASTGAQHGTTQHGTAQHGTHQHGTHQHGTHQHPAHDGRAGVEGTVAAAVKAAVAARHAGVTIEHVHRDARGGYDAVGTAANGSRVRYDVSGDYRTVTLDTRHHGGQHEGRPGQHRVPGTAVTGSRSVRVKAAIVAQHPGFTIGEVRQDADGSYRALGTRGGVRAFFTVSKDLATVVEHTGRTRDDAQAAPRR